MPVVLESRRMQLRQRLKVFKKIFSPINIPQGEKGIDNFVPFGREITHEGTCCIELSGGQHGQRQLLGMLERSGAAPHLVSTQ